MDDKEAKIIMREFSRIRKERERYHKLWLKSKIGSVEFNIYAERRNEAQKALKEMAELRRKAFAYILKSEIK